MSLKHEVPEGVSLLYPKEIALILNVSPAKIRRWLDKRVLPSQQDERNAWRSVRAEDLIAFAEERGLNLDWAKVL